LGAASIVARDAVNKFHSLSLPVSSHDDILIQQMFASKGHHKDVFFIISDTNHNKELLDVAKTAKKNGSVVISLIPSKSALSNVSAYSLSADIFELSDNQMPLSSRVVYLVILDVLIMGVALNIGNSHNITEA
jgi:RpiR family carbohydrate utilization transcriptional regulator